MTTKAKLIEKISHINNDHYLEAILNYLEESEKTAISLSESDLLSINKSDKQINNGAFITQPELDKKVTEWFGE